MANEITPPVVTTVEVNAVLPAAAMPVKPPVVTPVEVKAVTPAAAMPVKPPVVTPVEVKAVTPAAVAPVEVTKARPTTFAEDVAERLDRFAEEAAPNRILPQAKGVALTGSLYATMLTSLLAIYSVSDTSGWEEVLKRYEKGEGAFHPRYACRWMGVAIINGNTALVTLVTLAQQTAAKQTRAETLKQIDINMVANILSKYMPTEAISGLLAFYE
jgi:hypothetical protein